MEKEILDCGAGGPTPPLALFFEHGYKTHGIEISPKQLAGAQQFCKDHALELGISPGDMRSLPFADQSISFVYSYSSICHMTKSDVALAMREITRVLKKGGLCFVTFCSVDDQRLAEGEPRGPGEYAFEEDGETGVHSLFEDNEPDQYFRDFTLLRKEKRCVESFADGGRHAWAELAYIARKL